MEMEELPAAEAGISGAIPRRHAMATQRVCDLENTVASLTKERDACSEKVSSPINFGTRSWGPGTHACYGFIIPT